MGYPGRGVGLSHLPGRCTARMTCGESVPPGPMDSPGLRPWPLHKTRPPPCRRLPGSLHGHQDRRDTARARQR